jgi:hypothetical protein
MRLLHFGLALPDLDYRQKSSRGGLLADLSATKRFVASTSCCATVIRGEPLGAMCWIDYRIVWSHTALKSGFRLRINPALGVRASNASDLLIVQYLLELLCDRSPFGATIKIRRPSPAEFPHVMIPISG